MGTPKGRVTRNNSNSNINISLQDIHNLINSTKIELVTAMKDETEKINKTLTRLNDKVAGLESRLDAFDAKQKKQEKEIAEIKQSLKDLNPADNNKVLFEDICNETTARWRKRKFLVVSGIPEHSSGDLEERREKDAHTLEELGKEVGVDNLDVDPDDVSRIGRLDLNKPRLLRFKCDDGDTRRLLLKNSKDLRKSSNFQNVYINPDLTYFQRKRNADLRKEVKQRRESGENVGIRRGRIIDLSQSAHFH